MNFFTHKSLQYIISTLPLTSARAIVKLQYFRPGKIWPAGDKKKLSIYKRHSEEIDARLGQPITDFRCKIYGSPHEKSIVSGIRNVDFTTFISELSEPFRALIISATQCQ